MTAQIVNSKYAYVVQVCLEDSNGNWKWETVDSNRWQYKAIELRDHLLESDYKSVDEIYKSEFYKNWAS